MLDKATSQMVQIQQEALGVSRAILANQVGSGANAVSTERQSEVGQATPVTELASVNVENKRS
jgi:hypothetical protein